MSTFTGVIRAVCSLKAGRYFREQRAVEVIRTAGVFDEAAYLAENADVAESGIDPILHYIRHGDAEGRRAHPFFDGAWYLKTYPDVAGSGLMPLEHFIRYGVAEERSPHPHFDLRAYLAEHRFCRAHDLNPLAHLRLTSSSLPASRLGSGTESPLVEVVRRASPRSGNGRHGSVEATARGGEATIPRARRAAALACVAECPTMFSIIIPTWNRRAMIGKAIDSVLAQSYEHFEIVIADDGSTDGTREFLEEKYAEEIASKRLRWIEGTHAGVSAARNRGLTAAGGEWIAYLDSDNAWRPDYLLFIAAEFVARPTCRTAYAGMRVNRFHLGQEFDLCRPFDWARLAAQNFIDLNVFCHHQEVWAQLGGFDEDLRRLVDWELIIRFTRLYPPGFVDLILVDYFTFKDTDHITTTEPLQENWDKVWEKHQVARLAYGSDELRLAYVLWDFPALSQTFVLAEIREMVARGVDVRVYYKEVPQEAAGLDFPIEAERFGNVDELVARLALHRRNWLHSHFAYPAVTLATYPAAKRLNLPFSFMPHAVDIFHHANRKRNQLAEITRDALCQRVICYGEHHRGFLQSQGVPAEKMMMSSQAFDDLASVERGSDAEPAPGQTGRTRIVCIGRFIEKKGIEYLIEAARKLDPAKFEIDIYGYGPLEKKYAKMIRQFDLRAVTLKGSFHGDEARQAILRGADLFVLPCIEAENGDVDGFPTVFLEAMAAGVLVITTTVSANPDIIVDGVNGLLCRPKDADSLVDAIRWCAAEPAAVRRRLTENARKLMAEKSGAAEIVDTILDCCASPPLDIIMVTWFPTDGDDYERTLGIIQRVLDYTTTPFMLTIVDNGSGAKFLGALRNLIGGNEQIRVIETKADLGCGPASNIAFELAESEFMIYLCSNEAYIARPGWERSLLRYMREHGEVALAGHLVSSPSWSTGADYQEQRWFEKFRNPEYAATRRDENFEHVQGGAYILRRSVYVEHGGFNERLPMQQCDVEFSYYLQSCGCELGDLSSVLSVTQATRPTFHAMLDESVAVVHPVTTVADEELIDRCVAGECKRCNISGWIEEATQYGADRGEIVGGFVNPENGSTGVSRALYRVLAAGHWDHRNLKLAAWLTDGSLVEPLHLMFRVVGCEVVPGRAVELSALRIELVDLAIIANLSMEGWRRKREIWEEALGRMLLPGGSLIFSYELAEGAPDASHLKRLASELGYGCRIIRLESRVHGYGLAPLIVWRRGRG